METNKKVLEMAITDWMCDLSEMPDFQDDVSQAYLKDIITAIYELRGEEHE